MAHAVRSADLPNSPVCGTSPRAWGLLLAAVTAAVCPGSGATAEPTRLGYNRHIRPILSDNCFACHGPDKGNRAADLRLDDREAAIEAGAIAPGKPAESLILERIAATDPDEVMPPPDSHKKLTAAQKETLARWIAEGAEYEPHWAFVPPNDVAVPAVRAATWPRNEIDRFILARLEAEGLVPSPEASREVLLRRLSLDLTGLPPSPAEAAAFLGDTSPDAYEKLVERLLASPRYGERMAIDWLDAARYADTDGYQDDRDRSIWPWRDWVIAAFNANMPFDQFTIEQLAGDMLPNATREQRVATGFHRNHMFNAEGGIIAEEFNAEYTADRVETTAAVWLGQTFNCCRCHDHKYDPFTQRDFYALKAFFHNVPEGKTPFSLGTPEAEKELADLTALKNQAAAEVAVLVAAAGVGLDAWAADLVAAAPKDTPPAVLEAAKKEPAKRSDAEKKQLAVYRAGRGVAHPEWSARVAELTKQIAAKDAEIPKTLVMQELGPPKDAFILIRGAYDKRGEKVSAATPAVLPPLAADLPPNRLGLARWLTSPGHPLSARVTVNRFWQQFFGSGLVKTSEDFGSQGALPSHPELLDWLARDFVRGGWDVKRLVRQIVTTATYRQQAAVSHTLLARDPDNRLLARGPWFRLHGEFIRDQALAAAGLLVDTIGGPSVKPYHPPGMYEQIAAGGAYRQDSGPSLYRRSMYTYWKRSVPHPALLVFDMPFRETCTLRRPRSNTPLQSLNLMNDPTYIEAARALAQRMIREGGPTPEARLAHGFRLLLVRSPSPKELELLVQAHGRVLADFAADAAAARALLAVGTVKPDPAVDPTELAATTLVASTLLNLDETVTKP